MSELQSPRLHFRDVCEDDLKYMILSFGNAKTMRYISDGVTLTPKQCMKKLKELIELRDQKGPLRTWLAFEKDSGEYVGQFLIRMFTGVEEPGIGYSIEEDFRGKGFATEGTKALINFAFNHAKFDKISALTSPENEGSIKVLLKTGFKLDRVMKYHNPFRNREVPSNVYLLTNPVTEKQNKK